MRFVMLRSLIFKGIGLLTTILLISLLALPCFSFSAEMPLREILTEKYSKQYKKWREEVGGTYDSPFVTKVLADPEGYVKKVRENLDKARRLVKELEMETRKAFEGKDKKKFNLLQEQAKIMAEIGAPTTINLHIADYTDFMKRTGWRYEKTHKTSGQIEREFLRKYGREYGWEHEHRVEKNLERISEWDYESGPPGLDLSTPPGKVEKIGVVPYGQEGEGGLKLGETPGEAFFEVIDLQFEKVFQGLFKDYGMALKDCNDAEIQRIDRNFNSLQKTLFERLQRTRVQFEAGSKKWNNLEKRREKEVLNKIEKKLKKWQREFEKLKIKYKKECKKQEKTEREKAADEIKEKTAKKADEGGLLALHDGRKVTASASREIDEQVNLGGEGGLLALHDGRTIKASASRGVDENINLGGEGGLLALHDGRKVKASASREKGKEKEVVTPLVDKAPPGPPGQEDITIGGGKGETGT